MNARSPSRRRGGPLVMLAVLLSAWIAGRAATWENPFPVVDLELPDAGSLLAQRQSPEEAPVIAAILPPVTTTDRRQGTYAIAARPIDLTTGSGAEPGFTNADQAFSPAIAAGHILLIAAGFGADLNRGKGGDLALRQQGNAAVSPVAPPLPPAVQNADRWSLDAFAFYRAGSNSAAISQGRVPVYGASQAGANLQYRIAPGSTRDPRAFVRAYHAFVADGENEVAAGVSARPVGAIPVRAFAELRVTENVFGTELRPAAYMVTELAPARLPYDFRLEAYGGAGYVGGAVDTAFADGQVAVTREMVRFDGGRADNIRLSLGAGSWGGAQKDANRLDVGPSMRVDLNVGEVPARISLDWRERVAGDASPTSGLAATLSTRF